MDGKNTRPASQILARSEGGRRILKKGPPEPAQDSRMLRIQAIPGLKGAESRLYLNAAEIWFRMVV